MMWRFVTLLLTFSAVSLATNETYVAVLPKVLRPGEDYELSLTYLAGMDGETLGIMANLKEEENSDTSLASQTLNLAVSCPGSSQPCPVSTVLALQIPSDDLLTEDSYTVEVQGSIGSVTFRNSTSIQVSRKVSSIFIQTDKGMYKPSQTVKFRAIHVDSELKPVERSCNVSIHDMNDNRLKQWLNRITTNGVYANEFILSDRPPLGEWYIAVVCGRTSEKKIFEVAEYVLPKFEVTMTTPSFITPLYEKLQGSVSVRYTYGQPVKGSCVIRVAMEAYQYDETTYPHLTINTDLEDGQADFELTMDQLTRLVPEPRYTWSGWSPAYGMTNRNFNISAECTETLTEKTFKKTGSVPVKNNKFTIKFLEATPDTFKPGLNLSVYVQLTLADDTPPQASDITFPNGTMMRIGLFDYYSYRDPNGAANWTAPVSIATGGIVVFPITVPANKTYLYIEAKFSNGIEEAVRTSKNLNAFKSRDNQGLQISMQGSSSKIQAGQNVVFTFNTTSESSRIYFQLLSKGKLVQSDVTTGAAARSHSYTLVVDTQLAASLAPKGRMVAWYFTYDGEIISDSYDFGVDGAFSNNVSLSFDRLKVKPGESVTATVRAQPMSYVGLLAVDQSALLLRGGNDLSSDEVIEELQTYDSSSDINNYPGGPMFGGGMAEPGRPVRGKRSAMCRGCGWWPSPGGTDSLDVFKNAQVTVMTDGFIFVEPPPPPYYPRGPMFERGEAGGREMAGAPAPEAGPAGPAGPAGHAGPSVGQDAAGPATSGGYREVSRVRTDFSETWLWTDVILSPNGEEQIVSQVPDTITTWVATAFALHADYGLGLTTNPSEVIVFKPFFVSLDLPYSCVRGEELELKITVFNYMAEDLEVLVTIEKQTAFEVKGLNDVNFVFAKVEATAMVPANDGTTVVLSIFPVQLGPIPIEVKAQSTQSADAVRRTLLVEPEGVEQNYAVNFFVDLTESDSMEEEITLELPSNGVVEGSVKIEANAIGDIMGPTMNNLDRMVRLPTGCGEQTMILLAPNVFIMDYIKASGIIDPELVEKCTNYMESGYQRELNYQHTDGSFSAFESDPSGSTWLTAFVLKTFSAASKHIDIDSDNFNKGLIWMCRQQTSSGEFREPGRVIHVDMQGGAASGTTMAAYVTITLLEIGTLPSECDGVAEKAITYLQQRYNDDSGIRTDGYTMSLIAYAMALHDSDGHQDIQDAFKDLATEEDGMAHWSKQSYQEKNRENVYNYEDEGIQIFVPPRPQATASAIESTSYGMLTFLVLGQLADSVPVMRFLTGQRNSLGGYSSTQDTVLALQALSVFGSQSSADSQMEMGVKIESPDWVFTFPEKIRPQNKLVLQKMDVTPAAGQRIKLTATGSGVALIQLAVSYNLHTAYVEEGMNVDVTSTMLKHGEVQIDVCAWYTGDEMSGMSIVEVTALTGYVPTNLDELRQSVDGLRRIDPTGRKYAFYFDELTASSTCFTILTEKVNNVANLKKAQVTAYRYYQPEVRRSNFYMPSALIGQQICDSCPECCENNDQTIVFVDIEDGEQPVSDPRVINGGHDGTREINAAISPAAPVTFLLVVALFMALVA